MKLIMVAAALVTAFGNGAALAKVESSSRPMQFEACLANLRSVAGSLGVAPINIVETNAVRMVRFPTADGSVIVTCSRPDQKMVITKSDKRG
jgi:hypothetical protein